MRWNARPKEPPSSRSGSRRHGPTAPTFDAVSIKVNTTGSQNSNYSGRAGGLVVGNRTLRGLMRNIWNLNNLQIVGGPSWMDQNRFDIVATAPGRPTREERAAMAKTMMADRFNWSSARLDATLRPASAPASPGTTAPPAQFAGQELPSCGTRTDNGILKAGGVGLMHSVG